MALTPWITVFTLLLVLGSPFTACFAASAGEIVQQVTRAYGGMEKLQAIRTIEYELTGYRISRHQSRRTEPPYDRVPVSSFYAVDFERNLGVADGIGNYPGGLIFPFRSIVGLDTEYSLDTGQKTYYEGMSMMGFGDLKSSALRNLPPLLARELNRSLDSVEYLGTRAYRGQEYIHLKMEDTGILVHPVSHQIHALLTKRSDMATDGSMQVMRIFQDTVVHDGIPFPLAVYDYLPAENVFTTDFRLTYLQLNQDIENFMSIPEGFVQAGNPHMGYANDGELRVRPLADGVFLAGDNNTNILYVEFDDYYVAMEAGGMAWYAESVYELMQPHMQGKPLRYIVPTHYHDDHAVGIRFYTRIGATLLTTPEKAGYLRQLLEPIDEGALLKKVRFEWISGDRHLFQDDTGTLEVLVYANSPHTENMLVGVLPRIHANFSADLFVGWGGTPEIRQGASYGLRHFAQWLKGALGDRYSQLQTWIPVHGRPYSTAEIQTMLNQPSTIIRLPGNRPVLAEDWFLAYGLNDETTSGRRDVLIQTAVSH